MKIMLKIATFFLLICLFIYPAFPQSDFQPNLIPKPVYNKILKGHFELSEKTVIIINDLFIKPDAELFSEYLKSTYGIELKVLWSEDIYATTYKNSIKLIFRRGLSYYKLEQNHKKVIEIKNFLKNGYVLEVFKNSVEILGDSNGIFYGLQTLKQLILPSRDYKYRIPGMVIYDYPQYVWRGMHLDVCRHFFPKEFIKKYIDYLAMYKMNTFHWHLTDDQGWRIEIKKYPKLTTVGAYRKGTLAGHASNFPEKFDTIVYGGFYTQNDIREIVDYAVKRHITIVPEIEMPGHSLAALASYPELSCTGGPFETENKWGVFDDVFCPKEETFTFLENVLTEVMDLFPGKYIHIGGDECPKTTWKNSSYCQDLIKREGLKDENELQSYFVKRIEKFLNSKGRVLIGWDEILEGGLAPNAAIMSWRGTEGGIAAAKSGHYAVMTPGGYCYFDHYQGDPRNEPLAIGGYTTVEKVYSYNPTPVELDSNQKKFILGAQANVWTEYIPDEKHVEYMVFPRICALAEVLWSPSTSKDYNDFQNRLISHFGLLDKLGINYSRAIYEINQLVTPDTIHQGIEVKLIQKLKTSGIYYTLDGTDPTINSAKYDIPIKINRNSIIKAASFSTNGQVQGRSIQQYQISKSTGKRVDLVIPPSEYYNNGGSFTLVDGIFGRIPWNGKEWLGFSGTDIDATLDLGMIQKISSVTVDVLRDETSWIYLPGSVEVFISENGVDFKSIAKMEGDTLLKTGGLFIFNFQETVARYIRVLAKNPGKIPEGKPGAGYNSWLFMDEILVD
jgi:hexosaminidase